MEYTDLDIMKAIVECTRPNYILGKNSYQDIGIRTKHGMKYKNGNVFQLRFYENSNAITVFHLYDFKDGKTPYGCINSFELDALELFKLFKKKTPIEIWRM